LAPCEENDRERGILNAHITNTPAEGEVTRNPDEHDTLISMAPDLHDNIVLTYMMYRTYDTAGDTDLGTDPLRSEPGDD
jgi:hypothetical protein